MQVSAKPNAKIEQSTWLQRNGLEGYEYQLNGNNSNLPPDLPSQYQGQPLIRAIRNTNRIFLIYGADYNSGRYLLAVDLDTKRTIYALDFFSYIGVPGQTAKQMEYRYMELNWVAEQDDILYVSNNHQSYADASLLSNDPSDPSSGKNAFITALDPTTGTLLWRSQPLVSNAYTFALFGDFIIAGYGFTDEPDFLYLINRWTGQIAQKIPLKTGPDYILRKGEQIYVRTYDQDYIFQLREGGSK